MPHVRAAARFGCAHDLRLAYGADRQEREREEEDAGEEKLRGLDTHAAEWVNGDMEWRWGWGWGHYRVSVACACACACACVCVVTVFQTRWGIFSIRPSVCLSVCVCVCVCVCLAACLVGTRNENGRKLHHIDQSMCPGAGRNWLYRFLSCSLVSFLFKVWLASVVTATC